jgi:hypothetical protein
VEIREFAGVGLEKRTRLSRISRKESIGRTEAASPSVREGQPLDSKKKRTVRAEPTTTITVPLRLSVATL